MVICIVFIFYLISLNMKIFIVVLCLGRLSFASLDTGYPAGLMANCPGMTKNTTLSQKTKDSLTVIVLIPSDGWLGSKEKVCKLNHGGVACVAKHLDFRNRKTLLFISGYLDASFSPIVRSTAMPYLNHDYNVIIMEIYPILHRSYPIAARLTKPLGIILGNFLALLTRRGLNPDKLELLGGSLGAHIAYHAATRFHALTHFKPARLTGLDPAGPCFRTLARSERLNPDAAHKVDAVHTNIDGFGLADPVADIDFYVNGGEFQTAMLFDHLLPCLQLCSHVRSAIYWIISHYEPEKFLAVRCSSLSSARHGDCFNGEPQVNVLGPNTNFSQPGIYYLSATASMPYYMGLDGLKPRKHGVNNYLYKITDDEDIVV